MGNRVSYVKSKAGGKEGNIKQEDSKIVEDTNEQATNLDTSSANRLEQLKASDVDIVSALYDFNAGTDEDLSFKKRDQMTILDNGDSQWWYAEHRTTNMQGFIPSNFVALENSLELNEWYRKISKQEAEEQIMNPENPFGAFLIRKAGETAKGKHIMSVKSDHPRCGPRIIHYQIRTLDNGRFYIRVRTTFESLVKLVEHYSANADGMCCQLTKPCAASAPVLQNLSHYKPTKDH